MTLTIESDNKSKISIMVDERYMSHMGVIYVDSDSIAIDAGC